MTIYAFFVAHHICDLHRVPRAADDPHHELTRRSGRRRHQVGPGASRAQAYGYAGKGVLQKCDMT